MENVNENDGENEEAIDREIVDAMPIGKRKRTRIPEEILEEEGIDPDVPQHKFIRFVRENDRYYLEKQPVNMPQN